MLVGHQFVLFVYSFANLQKVYFALSPFGEKVMMSFKFITFSFCLIDNSRYEVYQSKSHLRVTLKRNISLKSKNT